MVTEAQASSCVTEHTWHTPSISFSFPKKPPFCKSMYSEQEGLWEKQDWCKSFKPMQLCKHIPTKNSNWYSGNTWGRSLRPRGYPRGHLNYTKTIKWKCLLYYRCCENQMQGKLGASRAASQAGDRRKRKTRMIPAGEPGRGTEAQV